MSALGRLALVVDGRRPPGVYRVESAVLAGTLAAALRSHGVVSWVLDTTDVRDKAAFLSRCAADLALPAWFGHNWDALADYLEDFSWRPARGYVVLVTNGHEFAQHAPQDFDALLEIFAAAATYWFAKDKLFLVLVDAGTRGGRALKALPG